MEKPLATTAPMMSVAGKRTVWHYIWRDRELYLIFFLPLIYYLVFRYAPILGGFMIAFKRYVPALGFASSKWVGLKYFLQFFRSVYFWRLLRNTLAINLIYLVIGFPLPIIFALLLNEIRVTWFKRTVQTISYLPHFISIVVVASMVITFLSPSFGIVNNFLVYLGFERIHFLVKPKYFWWIYNVMTIWQTTGFAAIIYLAALTGIDPQLYEAAIVDGANCWQQTWHITLPGISTTVIVMLLLRIGYLLSVGHEAIILLYNPTIYETADVINTYVYRRGLLNADYSYAAAVGLFQSVFGFVLIIIANKIVNKVSRQGLW
jgi:putative aldouronate transport system permease protein